MLETAVDLKIKLTCNIYLNSDVLDCICFQKWRQACVSTLKVVFDMGKKYIEVFIIDF